MKYKYYNGVCGIWAVLHAAGVIFIPESPHYLLHKNKNDRATASMSKLRDGTEAEIQAELATLKVPPYPYLLNIIIGLTRIFSSSLLYRLFKMAYLIDYLPCWCL